MPPLLLAVARPLLHGVFLCALLAPSVAARVALDRDATLSGVNAYFNRLTSLQGDFVHFTPSGKTLSGRFFAGRPNRLRFVYDGKEAPTVIVDGKWIGVLNHRMGVVNRYPLDQAKFPLALGDGFDIENHRGEIAVKRNNGELTIELHHEGRPGSPSVSLHFSVEDSDDGTGVDLRLKHWVIIDSQGLKTQISIFNVIEDAPLDARLFVIDDDVFAK